MTEPPQLSPRELQVASLVAQGCNNDEIARALTISLRTVNAHIESIKAKTGLRNRVKITLWWLAATNPNLPPLPQ